MVRLATTPSVRRGGGSLTRSQNETVVLGGISGGPLLVPDYRDGAWGWRLGGVISQATEELPPEKVVFEMVVAHRAEYIQSDGTLAKLI